MCHSQIIPAFDTHSVINPETVSINEDFLKVGVGDSGAVKCTWGDKDTVELPL